MKKVQLVSIFWTLIIAIPFTFIAILLSAYLTENLIKISTKLANISKHVLNLGRDVLFEAQVFGLLASIIIIVAILFITRLSTRTQLDS